MPTIQEIIHEIEQVAPPLYQEGYDNAQLITGNKRWNCTGALLTLDSTEDIVDEAIKLGVNLIIAHHPIVFKGLKSLTGKNYVERTMIKAIKHDIAIYACHTNLDNQITGVNAKICEKLDLKSTQILAPKKSTLTHLITFAPESCAEQVREAMFAAGAGSIGNYDKCSFNIKGIGTYRGNDQSNPTIGAKGQLMQEEEIRIEVVVERHVIGAVLSALKQAHIYEEVAYYIHDIENVNQDIGAGMIGELPNEIPSEQFLQLLKDIFKTNCVRHTNIHTPTIKRIAVCGGAGSFLLPVAKAKQADVFITGDFKYHEFFDAENKIIIADIGHFESEQFTNELFAEIITKKFSNFAVHFSEINTNPINYI